MSGETYNPAATRTKEVYPDVSRRRWDELVLPLIWGFVSLSCIYSSATQHLPWGRINAGIGLAFLVLFAWDGRRIWGWKLEMLPYGLRVRRQFRWSTIPWETISSVQSVPIRFLCVRNREAIQLQLASHSSERLGAFEAEFAHALRDRLRTEIKQRGEH
jgi:hypothetical protein